MLLFRRIYRQNLVLVLLISAFDEFLSYAFACAQIPLGIALDRYGPRTVNGFLLMIASVGATILLLRSRSKLFC